MHVLYKIAALILGKLKDNIIKIGLYRCHFFRNVPTFSAQLFHKTPLNDSLGRMFICLVSQIIIAATGQLSKCNGWSTSIAFRILVKSHKSLKGTKSFACNYSLKKMKTYQNTLERTSHRVLLLLSYNLQLHRKMSPSQVFSCYFC